MTHDAISLDGPEMPGTLIKQGAEALVYKTTYLQPHNPALLKYRPRKAYRHPTLDARLTKHRCLSEARLLVRAYNAGIAVPAVYFVDDVRGQIFMEWIEGWSVRDVLDEALERPDGEAIVDKMMRKIGAVVGALHKIDVVHGDLTTSNIMIRRKEWEGMLGEGGWKEEVGNWEGEMVLIDFGLGSQSSAEEDKAVDLYVLERAFGSTHPRAKPLFEDVLKAYAENYKGSKGVLRRLQDVRLRGRKKSMIG